LLGSRDSPLGDTRGHGSPLMANDFDWFDWNSARERMAQMQIIARGIRDPAVIRAMRRVPRHEFVNPEFLDQSYADRPLPIGFGVTISQPYIVGYMTEALELGHEDRVLEIGAGSGYQTAVLAEIVREVYSIEIVPALARRAGRKLRELGYRNVRLICADGHQGWPRAAPFDAILLTAAPPRIPEPLIEQLAMDGRLIAPVGPGFDQVIRRLHRTPRGIVTEELIGVRFVPMTGGLPRERG
jgi:protein-L-isoaspartate(D-aspartate) O-methyltransferase